MKLLGIPSTGPSTLKQEGAHERLSRHASEQGGLQFIHCVIRAIEVHVEDYFELGWRIWWRHREQSSIGIIFTRR